MAADRAFLLKSAVKDVAALNGLLATFMGRPFNDQGGSGFHVHVSLERDGSNAFADRDDPEGISADMRSFVAGVLLHAPALMALLNPTINAYRRIVPDSLAPTHANWGWDNRTAMVRIPPERGGATRLEVRVGDGSANAYLTVAAILFAGLHGVREALPLQPPLTGDVAAAGPDMRGASLARSLEESLGGAGGRCGAAGPPRPGADRHVRAAQAVRDRAPSRVGVRLGGRRVPPPPLRGKP